MFDASNFQIGAVLLQSCQDTNILNSEISKILTRLTTQTELRLSTLMRECTAIPHPLTEYEFVSEIKTSKSFFTDLKPIIFLFTQKSNRKLRVYKFQLLLMNFPNVHSF